MRIFGVTFTSSSSFKSVYQKYTPIVRFIFRDTPNDQVIDRAASAVQVKFWNLLASLVQSEVWGALNFVTHAFVGW